MSYTNAKLHLLFVSALYDFPFPTRGKKKCVDKEEMRRQRKMFTIMKPF